MSTCEKYGVNYERQNYPQYWHKIIEKYKLKPVNQNIFTDLPSYMFLGMIGNKIYENITTGPCLLTPKEINVLNRNTAYDDVEHMLMRHPTFEDYYSVGINVKDSYKTHMVIETYEYAKLIEYKTGIPFEDALYLTKKSAKNLMKFYDKKLDNITFYPTHRNDVDKKLRELCMEYYPYYLNTSNLSKKGREYIKNNPEESTFLRIKVSFLPQLIGKEKTTIIEPSSSLEGIKHAYNLTETTGVVVRSPPSLKNKPVMNQGYANEILYLNSNLENEFKKIKINKSGKCGSCILYTLKLFMCNNNIIYTPKSCNECLKSMYDSLLNIIP